MSGPYHMRKAAGLGVAAALVALVVFWGCESESPSGPAAGDSDLVIQALLAGSSILEVGETTPVSVWVVTRDEAPAAGVSVRFGEVGNASSGEFVPGSVLTDSLGFAQSSYRAVSIDSGRVDLKAIAGSDVGYLSLLVVPAGGLSLGVRVVASESSIPADGQTTTELTIYVGRSGGAGATEVVKLVAGELFDDRDHDGVFSDGDVLVRDNDQDGEWDAIGSVDSPVVSDTAGVAYATYIAGFEEGIVFIKVTVDSVATDFEITLHSEQSTVSVAAMPLELWADGYAEASVSVTVHDWQGKLLQGKLVRFTAGEPFEDEGDEPNGYYDTGEAFNDLNGNGRWDAMGSITSSATTWANGEASATYTAGREAGVVTIYASTRESRDGVSVTLIELPRVDHVDWNWSPEWLYANGLSEATLSMTLYDQNGSVIPGKGVALEADAGVIAATAVADLDGVLTSAFRAPGSAGTATVQVSADDWSQSIPIEIAELPGLLSIEMISDQEEICLLGSGGTDGALLQAACVTLEGQPAPLGVPVVFTITSGPGGDEVFEESGATSATTLTDADGVARAVLRAGSLPGVVRVTAGNGAVEGTVEIGVSVGPPASITVHTSYAELDSWEQTWVEAVVMDAYNNPVEDGTLVYFTVDEGLVEGTDGQATSGTLNGRATATYYSMSPEPGGDGEAQITASTASGTVSATTYVRIPIAGETVTVLTAHANPPSLTVQGECNEDYSVLTANCFLRPDEPAPGGIPVTFAILYGPGGGENLNGDGDSAVVETDAAGVVQVTLHSGTVSGALHIRIGAGTAHKNLYLGISAGPPAGLVATPDTCYVRCGSRAGVEAIVHDIYNNPVVDGTVVYFTVDEGFIWGSDGYGTDGTFEGRAYATYEATCDDDRELDVATITCTTDGGVSEQTTIRLPPLGENPGDPGPIARIQLSPSLSEIGVHGTGATEQCELIATCYDSNDWPVGRDQEVVFEITGGPGGGEEIEDAGWGPVTVYTDDASQVGVTLRSGTISGTVRIEARADSLAANSALVSIAAGPPAYISVGVDPLNIRGWDVVAVEAEVTTIVSDIYNNPVRDGTTVYFTCDEGIIRGWDGNLGSSPTLGGIALATYFSGLPRDDGLVQIVASSAGGTVVGYGALITSGPPAFVTFVAPLPPVYLAADGESSRMLTIEVLDVNGNFVVAGTEVGFYTDLGQIDGSALTADGVYGSVAQAELRSEVLPRDYSYSVPDDGIGGVACVEGFAGLAGSSCDTLDVIFTTSIAHRNNSRINIDADVNVNTTVPFEVEVRDRPGNPLSGHLLAVSVTGGGSVTPTGTTDVWGTAGLLFTAPGTDTSCVITVIDNDPTYGGMILTATVSIVD